MKMVPEIATHSEKKALPVLWNVFESRCDAAIEGVDGKQVPKREARSSRRVGAFDTQYMIGVVLFEGKSLPIQGEYRLEWGIIDAFTFREVNHAELEVRDGLQMISLSSRMVSAWALGQYIVVLACSRLGLIFCPGVVRVTVLLID